MLSLYSITLKFVLYEVIFVVWRVGLTCELTYCMWRVAFRPKFLCRLVLCLRKNSVTVSLHFGYVPEFQGPSRQSAMSPKKFGTGDRKLAL